MEPTQQPPKIEKMSFEEFQALTKQQTPPVTEDISGTAIGAPKKEAQESEPKKMSFQEFQALTKEQSPQPVRQGQATPAEPSQLPLPMGTKEPPKPPAAAQGGVPASKKPRIKIPAYVRRHMEMDDRGEPILYITRSPNQKTGVNVARHKAKIKKNFRKEARERWSKAGRAWEDISDEVKEDINKAADRRADKLINSWINEQKGTESIWIKGDPAYTDNALLDRGEIANFWKYIAPVEYFLAPRLLAPIEALLMPGGDVEVVEKSDLGKTYSKENKITTLDYLGRLAPSTIISTAIKAGGYANKEHIKELQAGKEMVSYIPEIGDYITDTAENMGLISKDWSNSWWLNAVLGGGIAAPIILMEPDIATPIIAAAGFISGGPGGAAGGFLASKGAKGLKAIRPIARLNKTANRATKLKANLAEVSGGSASARNKAALKAIGDSQKTSLGTVLKETSASRLATGGVNTKLQDSIAAEIDTMQQARKAAPDAIDAVEKLDLDKLAAKEKTKTPRKRTSWRTPIPKESTVEGVTYTPRLGVAQTKADALEKEGIDGVVYNVKKLLAENDSVFFGWDQLRPQVIKLSDLDELAIGKLDSEKLRRAREFIASGKPMMPPDVSRANGKWVINDGRHRIAALRELGKTEIIVDVSLKDARKAAEKATKAANKAAKAAEEAEFDKLQKLTAGKELEVLEYAQSKAMADALLARDLQKRKIYAEGLSQFKPKLATQKEYRKLTDKIQSKYDELADLEKSIHKTGATDAALAKRAKLIDEIQTEQKAISKLNAQSGLEVAAKRAEMAQEAADKSRRLADVLTQVAVKSARLGDEAFEKGLKDITKTYESNKAWLNKADTKNNLDADMLYETVVGALDDILESTDSLKKSLGVKATKYGVPELQSGLRELYGTDKIEEVIGLFDKTFGEGKFANFAANLGSDRLKYAIGNADGLRTPIDAELYDELQQAMRSLVEQGIKRQKSDLGIELAEQVLETSDFVTYMTNIQGVNWIDLRLRQLSRMAESLKDFADPARKAFGSTSKAVIKVGRSMDSFFKRSANEVAEVLTSTIKETSEGATKESLILDLGREAQEYAAEGAEATPYIRELLVHLNMGKESNISKQKAAVKAFMENPDDKIYDKIVLGAYRQRNLKKLMTTTEPLKITGGDTMSNVGKSSWWETSKSWWLRNIAEEALEKGAQKASEEVGDKSLDAFIIAFLGGPRTGEEAGALVAGAKKRVLEKLQKKPDATYEDIEKVITGSMTNWGKKEIVFDMSARGLAFRAAALANATSQERAVFDMLRRVGGVSEETAKGYKAMKASGDSVNAEDFAGVLDLLRRYDLPISREVYKTTERNVSATLKALGKLGGEGQTAFIPTGIIEHAAKSLDNITKQLIQYDPTGDVSTKMSINALTGWMSLWRSSLVTGLVAPNPGHFTNIFFGNFSQISGEVGYGTATRVAAQTLHTFIPYFGRKVDEIMLKNMDKTGPNTTLGSIFNTVLNPHLSAFFNRSIAKDSDKILGAGSKYAKTWGELREIAVREGVMSTFIGTDIRKALSKRMTDQLAESPSATKFKSAKKIASDIIYGVPYKKFAETVEQRQRVALFMDLVMRKGMDPKEAAENVKKALYDWDTPLADWETKWLNNLFLFWRFWKLSLGQAGRHLTDPFKAPIEKPTDLISYSMLQKAPLGRGISQARIAAAAPELAFDKLKHDMEQQLESGEVTPEEYYMFLLSIKYPHWKKGGNKVFLANYPIDSQLSEQYQRVKGYAPTHEAITMPGLTLLDTYGMMLSMLSGLSATAVTTARAVSGEEDVAATDAINKAVQTITDPVSELGNPATERGIGLIQEFFMGATPNYTAPYVRLKPSEKKMLEILNGSGFLSESIKKRKTDPEGVVRANRMMVELFRMTPFFGTQIYRLMDPALEAHEKEGLAEGIAHWMRQVSGLGKVYAHDPEYSISRSISDIGDKTKALAEEAKYESIVREEDVTLEEE